MQCKDDRIKIYVKKLERALVEMPKLPKEKFPYTQVGAFERSIIRHSEELKRSIKLYKWAINKEQV